jgi:hypothetical protein
MPTLPHSLNWVYPHQQPCLLIIIQARRLKMEDRYNNIMQELTKNLQDAEYRMELVMHKEDFQDAFCQGLQFSLEILKEAHFESTDFYKKN